MIKKFPTKLTFVTKSKTFKTNPKHTIFHAEPIAKRDMAAKIAARTEGRSHRILTKKVESAFARSALKSTKANQFSNLVKQKTRALTKAFNLSKKRGFKSLEKTSKRLDVNIPRFGRLEPGSRWDANMATRVSASEGRALGFPPKEISKDMKAFYQKGLPKAKLKKHRATLSKIYAKPKSWKQRPKLIATYRARAKSELKAAKLDRSIYRDTTIQKQTGVTKKGKPTWTTVWTQPKREFKKWNKE